jgi:DNA/RNA endonuclease YhcR with UshA esterase domain
LRALRYGALLLAGIGLLVLWIVARQAEAPTVQVRDVSAGMNWAYARVRGVVTRYPVYDEETGALSFWVDDGTGLIRVICYRNEGQALINTARVPVIGDQVAVGGTIRLKDDLRSLVLNVPDHLEVERPVPVEVPVADVAGQLYQAGRLYQKVLVRGQVREVRTPYQGLTVVRIRDKTGEIDVIYDTDMIRLQGEPMQVVPGDSVSVRGAVTSYKGTPQIALDAAQGLQRLPDEIPIATRGQIGEIGSQDLDRPVRVAGVVKDVHWLSPDGSMGLKCVLSDGTGEIALVLWKDLLDEMGQGVDRAAVFYPQEGMWLDVQAVVSTYRGEMELIPELACDVHIVEARPWEKAGVSPSGRDDRASTATLIPTSTRGVATGRDDRAPTEGPGPGATSVQTPIPGRRNERDDRAPTATATRALTATPSPMATRGVQAVQTGALSAAQVGHDVTIEGKIEDASQFASGVKFYVNDGSGPLAVWIPQALYGQLSGAADWIVNSQVSVSGRVDLYKGEIEVIPQALGDLVLVNRAMPPGASGTRLADLRVDDVGQRVTVEASIVSVDVFSAGVKCKIDDGSGQVVLLLWHEVYDAVPGKERLVVGTRIRVTGKVDEYRGELELVPGLGVDVVVIAAQAF